MAIYPSVIAGLVGGVLALIISYFLLRVIAYIKAKNRIKSDREISAAVDSGQDEVTHRLRLAQDDKFTAKVLEETVPDVYRPLATEKAKFEMEVLDLEHVVGVAIGNAAEEESGQVIPSISVFYEQDDGQDRQEAERIINAALSADGKALAETSVPIKSVITGKIVVRNSDPPFAPPRIRIVPVLNRLSSKVRPVFGGVSISRDSLESGTLATCCYDQDPLPNVPMFYYMLSNSHVLAGEDAVVGAAIVQPGWSDDGKLPYDYIGWLKKYTEFKFLKEESEPVNEESEPVNYVDAAIAAGHFTELDRTLCWTGNLLGCDYKPSSNTEVQKTGAATAFTRGKILNIDATIDVNIYGETARFRHQIVTQRITEAGDSGSLLVNSSNRRAIGLIFADSIKEQHTYANNILLVEYFLNVRVAEDGTSPPAVGSLFRLGNSQDRVRS